MSRQRMIYPEIFTSDDFMSLSHGARLLFIGLFTTADDYGRGKGEPAAMKAAIFPGDDVARDLVRTWAEEVQSRGMVRLYSVEGTLYYDLPAWERWQTPKYRAKSRIPEFPSNSKRPGRVRAESGPNQPGSSPEPGPLRATRVIERRGEESIGEGSSANSQVGQATERPADPDLSPPDRTNPDPDRTNPDPDQPEPTLPPPDDLSDAALRARHAAAVKRAQATGDIPPPDGFRPVGENRDTYRDGIEAARAALKSKP